KRVEFVCLDKEDQLDPQETATTTGVTDNFLGNTQIHGLSHLQSSFPIIHRCLWTAAFLTALGLLLTWSFESLGYLMSHPVHTNVKMTWVSQLPFPAVTLCRIQSMTRAAYGDSGLNSTLAHHRPKAMDSQHLLSLSSQLEHPIDDMLIKCWFRGKTCSSQDFTPVFTRYGKCYTFNADKNHPKVTRQGGMGNGLEIMLDIQQEEYLPIWRETNETSFEAGIRVQIHSQDEPPYIHQLGFGVSPGFQTFVSCQEQRLTYLPQPWGNCRASMPREQFLPGYSTYSISACRLQCEKEAVMRNCNCRMVHMPGNETICSPNVYISCADHALAEDPSDRCTCPMPCNLTRFGKEISMVRIPNKGSATYLARKYNKDVSYIRENFLVLDIFFEALNYETIEQKKAYDLASLLGDIGGQMGLFIGASLLTILEILDYLYEVSYTEDTCRKVTRSKQEINVSTLVLDDVKDQSSTEVRGRHPEGAYATTMLPNHHRHYTHHGVFEDFAC
uniref:Acid sensing ion channel subunit family member 4 n=1 Tax=Leptobrachium leishanense TaxID=445787 RepID=A0A8C5Q8D7_9ANUR